MFTLRSARPPSPAAFLSAALFAMLPASAAAQHEADPGTSYVFEVRATAQFAALRAGFDVIDDPAPGRGPLRVVVQPGGELAAFRALVPDARLIDRGRPFREVAAERAAAGSDMPDSAYYTTAEIEQEIDALVAAYPSLARKVELTALPGAARTHGNRPIWALAVSDQIGVDEQEPAIVVAGQHHARELNSPHIVLRAAARTLAGYSTDPTLTQCVDATVVWFVPCVNPDGVEHVWNVDQYWRKNRRDHHNGDFGVDLNRNYPAQWGACGASSRTWSETYRGPAAASEPETRTMRALIEAERPELYIDVHSHGREVLFPYPSCGSIGASFQAMLQHYIDDLRTPMSYASRIASAAGEAPEDHWASGGTLGLLIEIGTSFQPVFSATVSEELRVWPGIRRALTTWAPALRGRLRSIHGAQPLAVDIDVAPSPFVHGERRRSRARDGRYGLWLPPGSWQITFSATGFDPVTLPVTVSAYDQPQSLDVELVPSWPPAVLTATPPPRVGAATQLGYASPGDAGLTYWIALSGGTSPGLQLGSRTLPLNVDPLFEASLSAAPMLVGNLGVLSANADGIATLNLPNLPALAGIPFHAAGITFEAGYPSGVKRWSPAIALTIAP